MLILTGSSTASVSLQTPSLSIVSNLPSPTPGTEFKIILIDSDQNINSGARDCLDLFRDTAIIPTMRMVNLLLLRMLQMLISLLFPLLL